MAERKGLRGAISEVAQRASAVVRLQTELTRAELASSGKNAAAGAGLMIAAAFFAVFAFALLTALFVVALAIALPLWLAILIVLVVYLIVAAILVLLGRGRFREAKGAPMAREQARLTKAAVGLDGAEDRAPTRPSGASQDAKAIPAPARSDGPDRGNG